MNGQSHNLKFESTKIIGYKSGKQINKITIHLRLYYDIMLNADWECKK